MREKDLGATASQSLAVEALRLAEVATAGPWELIFDRVPARNFSTGEPQGTAPNWRTLRVVDGENRLLLRIAADPEQVLKAEDMDFIARARTLLPELARVVLDTQEPRSSGDTQKGSPEDGS